MLFMCHGVFHATTVHVVHVPSGFSMSWWFVLFLCHGVFYKSWWFMFCLHVMVVHAVHVPFVFACHGSSCCSCVMVFFHVMAVHVHVPSWFVHVVVVHVVHLPWCFLKGMMGHALFTCHGGSCCSCAVRFFSCHGGSCCSCVLMFHHVMAVHVVHVPCCFYMTWWFMLFMCHGVVYVMMVHAVHVSLCFFKVMVVHVAHV